MFEVSRLRAALPVLMLSLISIFAVPVFSQDNVKTRGGGVGDVADTRRTRAADGADAANGVKNANPPANKKQIDFGFVPMDAARKFVAFTDEVLPDGTTEETTTRVDVPSDGNGITIEKGLQADRKVVVTAFTDRADLSAQFFPPWFEGNLNRPKRTGEGGGDGKKTDKYDHWAAIFSEQGTVTVSFTPNPISTGFSLVRNQAQPLPKTVIATVLPAAEAGNITFAITQGNAPADGQASILSRKNNGNGTWTLMIGGSRASGAKKDVTLTASKGNQRAGMALVTVVVPKTNTRRIRNVVVKNTHRFIVDPTTGGKTSLLETDARALVEITIKDQFGEVLDSVYDGRFVVTEAFFNQNFRPAGWAVWVAPGTPINIPDGKLANGIIFDGTGVLTRVQFAEFDKGQIAKWKVFQLDVNGTNNMIYHSLRNKFPGVGRFAQIGDQELTVRGHVITPRFTRVIVAFPTNNIRNLVQVREQAAP